MKIIFLGTPEFAVPTLEKLHAEGHKILLAVSQPDRPAGRGQKVRPTPVAVKAAALEIPVYQPEDVNAEEALKKIGALKPDVIVVAAFGQFLKKRFRELAPRGCLNVHASLLPKLRGAAPINRAVMGGHTTAGVTIMKIEAKMDTGDMYLRGEAPIGPETTAGELHDRLAVIGANLMAETLRRIEAGTIYPVPQNEAEATHAPKIAPEERRIDWSLPATAVDQKIRGLSPAPGAFTFYKGARLQILRSHLAAEGARKASGTVTALKSGYFEVSAGNGTVALLEVRAEGKKAMNAAEWARGARIQIGDLFEHGL
ncbi:MAG: methionyl-tRNA formyltransferase [Nitrospinae bacterium]|nr:methionyl-tRNA formyltransferase [Nitrospinota bacterium]